MVIRIEMSIFRLYYLQTVPSGFHEPRLRCWQRLSGDLAMKLLLPMSAVVITVIIIN